VALVTCIDCGKEHSDQAIACPQCGKPQLQASDSPPSTTTAQLEKKAGGPNGCLAATGLICGFLVLVGVISALAPKSMTPGDPGEKAKPVDNAWVPKGFELYNDNIAVRWRKSGEISCGYRDTCYQMELVSKEGCSYLYAELTRLNSAGDNVGMTNDTTSNLEPGQNAVLTFSAFDDDNSARLAEVKCM